MTLARSAFLSLLTSSTAFAQSPAAESLFREGRALIKQGRLQDGCDKFEASEMIEPSVGTLLNLGDCREKLGKVATAWAAFRKAEAMAKASGKDEKRAAEAQRRAARLEPQLPNLTIAAKQTPGLVIKRNGEKLDPAVLDTPVPLDPGTYRIVAEAPGYKPYQLDVTIAIRGKRTITIPPLQKDEVAVAKKPLSDEPIADIAPIPSAAPPPRGLRFDEPVHRSTWTTARDVSVGAAALGAIAIGGGIYYGLRSHDLEDRSDKLCPNVMCGDPQGLKLNDDAQTAATRANILYVLGGAAFATSAVLWIVGEPEQHLVIRPDISGNSVGASVQGVF
jgi:tetratricopeptide (TPR) repeat protein